MSTHKERSDSRRAADASRASLERWPLPVAGQVQRRLLVAWCLGVLVFGYGPAVTYGAIAWLFNEYQWRWTYLLYITEVPLVGGFFVLLLPWLWYRPIHRQLTAWHAGASASADECMAVYRQAMRLPWRTAVSSFLAGLLGYLIGLSVLHWQAQQPLIEIAKTFPAIPLVGGMMGAFCYFGTTRALYPVLAWCSLQLQYPGTVHRSSLGEKFLATTFVLIIATLCLLQPAAYTLGQVVTERQLSERAVVQLQWIAPRMRAAARVEDQVALLPDAAIGARGYAFLVEEADGTIVGPHPRGLTRVDAERFYCAQDRFGAHAGGWATCLRSHLRERQGSWVDRVAVHRVVSYIRGIMPGRVLLSVVYPGDFSLPLQHFMQFTLLVMLQVIFVVFLFGRYFTRSITTPLEHLADAARDVAGGGKLSQHVPITTNDELGELARAFNHMMDQLQSSHTRLELYTRQLERSTQQLSAVNQEMEDLLRVVSHDLRAPLINIQGFSQRLIPLMEQTLRTLDRVAATGAPAPLELQQMRASVDAKFTESLRFIAKGVEKMDALLSSLLAVSRVGRKADPLQPNDLDGILDDVLATFDHQLKEQAIEVIRHPLPAKVWCRRNEINQVFSNLLANAIHYMGPMERRFIDISGVDGPDHVACRIQDSGVGINPEDQERIFQMFTRLHAVDVPGEGVGLAYVRKILRSHGGTIRVESQRGQGSVFIFTLPKQLEATGGGPR